jgi:glyoxylase-like metal-dependent hydrolase (beta-lactamase superfamily II)
VRRRLSLLLLVALAGGVAAASLGLTLAHLAIRRERPDLPGAADLSAAIAGPGAPIRAFWINTASQAMPRSGVLDPARDPLPDERYVMSHPAFVLEWSDGRLLLVDLGMDAAGARSFGRPIELVAGGEPIVPIVSAAEALGPAASRVAGVVFTHLHADHVGGITELCRARTSPLPVYLGAAQAERPNYTTRPGLETVQQAPCAEIRELPPEPMAALPDLPGVVVVPVAGHTPGSQWIFARVDAPLGSTDAARDALFVGDTVNALDGILGDAPKPFLYRLLVVPEDEVRQAALRALARELRARHGATLVVSHDQRALEALRLAPFGSTARRVR